jgi:hypothetical protein
VTDSENVGLCNEQAMSGQSPGNHRAIADGLMLLALLITMPK